MLDRVVNFSFDTLDTDESLDIKHSKSKEIPSDNLPDAMVLVDYSEYKIQSLKSRDDESIENIGKPIYSTELMNKSRGFRINSLYNIPNEEEQKSVSKFNSDIDVDDYIPVKHIMSNAEIRLYNLLKNRLKGLNIDIFVQVRLADLFRVTKEREKADKNARWTNKAIAKIANKSVDYVICDSATKEIICFIELFDDTHNRIDRISRDNLLRKLCDRHNIKLFNLTNSIDNIEKNRRETWQIEEYLFNRVAMDCPLCGSKVKAKLSNIGHRFYGCNSRYKNNICPYSYDIDP